MQPNIVNRPVVPDDLPRVSQLHAKVFGPGRFTRAAYRVREGAAPISNFCRVACLSERMIASVRFTHVTIGGAEGALLLGPLAVDPDLPGAQQLLQAALGEVGEVVTEPAVEAQLGFSVVLVGAVAVEVAVGEDGTNVAVEVDGGFGSRRKGEREEGGRGEERREAQGEWE